MLVIYSMCAVPDATKASGDCSWTKVAEDSYAGTEASWGTVSPSITRPMWKG